MFNLFVWYPMSKIDNERCLEKFYELNISRCDKVGYVPTINPFKFSDKCYCENYDKIYFDLEDEE